MASGMSQSLARSVLDGLLNGTGLTFTPYLALMTTASSATAFGTEMTGGGYARQPVSAATASGNSAASDASILFSNLPASTIAGVSLVDTASGAPTRWLYLDGLSITVSAGENKTLDAGNLIASLT